MRQLVLSFTLALVCFAARFACGQDSEPLAQLGAWLETPAGSRPELASQEFAKTGLSWEQAERARDLLWKDALARLQTERNDEFEAKELAFEEQKLKFEFRVFGEAPEGVS